jgi:plasmid stabilization system protein ParE
VFKVIVSPKAWQDFFEIFDFIAVADPEAAERFSNSLLAHIDLLTTFPTLEHAQQLEKCAHCFIVRSESTIKSTSNEGQLRSFTSGMARVDHLSSDCYFAARGTTLISNTVGHCFPVTNRRSPLAS